MSLDVIPFSVEEERIIDCHQTTIKNHIPPHKRDYDYRVHVKLGVKQRYTSRNAHSILNLLNL